jgi:phospho-N-acetylmuramoyl-pentapeptide-transferase
MINALTLGAIALVATAAAGYPAISLLRRLNIGKEIHDYLRQPVLSAVGDAPQLAPERHAAKAGTPTMGGAFMIAGIVLITLGGNFFGRYSIGLPLLVMGSLGLLGGIDDFGSLRGREQWALNKRVKLLAFLAVGAATAYALYDLVELRHVHIPYEGSHDIGWVFLPIALAVVVLTAGGVAVADGLDGLVAGTASIAFAAYGAIALLQEQTFLGAFCLTVTGACLGFLWHNAHPASVFMGDVGALALGGGLAVVAFMTGHWLLLPIIGIVFVTEGASSYLQIGYFKLTGGRRIFRMAPLHHHFEEVGWSEVQVVQRFWIAGVLGAMAGVALAAEVWS